MRRNDDRHEHLANRHHFFKNDVILHTCSGGRVDRRVHGDAAHVTGNGR